jgi:GDP-L-fucose synthase
MGLQVGYKKILVTGSGGVLGSSLQKIRAEFSPSEFIFLTSKDCDLTDLASTYEIIARHKPDAILHLAAVSGGIGLSMKLQGTMLRDNTLMAFSVLEAARKCDVKKTIMTLTTGMYPPDAPIPLKESSIHEGYPHESNYGSSFAKRIVDPAIRGYRDEFGMSVVGLVPSGIFGDNDYFNPDDAAMVPALIRRFYDRRNTDDQIIIWGDGTPLREYTYAEDLARIYMWALYNYDDAQVLNVGTTEENSVGDIAFMIADIMGVDRDRIFFDTSKPAGIFKKSTDNSRFMALSQFQYTPFREGLKKTIQWFCETFENRPEEVRTYSKANRT